MAFTKITAPSSIQTAAPHYVNSIAVAPDRTVYTLARVTENGHTRTDLVQIAPPELKGTA